MRSQRNILGVLIVLAGSFAAAIDKPKFKNIILIGWDGTQRDRMESLLKSGKLPNLKALVATGSYVSTQVGDGITETKPGWAQILSGYNTTRIGVLDNFSYAPIPVGLTLFERLKKQFGPAEITTLFVAGKSNNLAARGPHKVCTNCLTRDQENLLQTGWWDDSIKAPTYQNKPRILQQRTGEPYFNAVKSIDLYKIGLNKAKNVLPEVMKALEQNKTKRFFAFFHFEEPDELGHIYGEDSPEYADAIVQNDVNLGKILDELKKLHLSEDTLVFITTDHGFDKGRRSHSRAPDTWLAANFKGLSKNGDRRDFTPTVLDFYGFDLAQVTPSLDGHSLWPVKP